MQLHELKLDSTRLLCIDLHGKIYQIKKQRGRYYIQHSKGQLTVTPLFKELFEKGSKQDWIFNGHFMEQSFEDYKSTFRNPKSQSI